MDENTKAVLISFITLVLVPLIAYFTTKALKRK